MGKLIYGMIQSLDGYTEDEHGKGARDFIGGTNFPVTHDVYDRVTRVLTHARC